MSRHAKLLAASGLVAIGVIAVGASVGEAVLHPDLPEDKRHCLIDQPPPRTMLVGLDTSDPLVAIHPREIGFDVGRAVESLKKGDRIVAIDVEGKAPGEVMPIVDQCDPGDDDNTARNAFKSMILDPIEKHVMDSRSQPASPESPIVETIVQAASDPSLNRKGSILNILIVTDGLQNTRLQSAYRHGSEFSKPDPVLLNGVTVELDVVKNERDLALQPVAVVRLIAWLRAAGANVIYAEPAWLRLAESPSHAHRRAASR